MLRGEALKAGAQCLVGHARGVALNAGARGQRSPPSATVRCDPTALRKLGRHEYLSMSQNITNDIIASDYESSAFQGYQKLS